MVRISAADLGKLPPHKDGWSRFDAMRDDEIAQRAASDPDSVPVDFDWSGAELRFPQLKQAMSLRIDPDVLAFFKTSGKGYQTRMNAVLRAYMEHRLRERR